MAEKLSPGVFIEEVASDLQVIQGVSTSNLGIVGFTPAGPEDEPVLVTSFEQFVQKMGGLTLNSFLPLEVAAFFANGGSRAFVVRVVPADAVEAEAWIQAKHYDEEIEAGDGTATAFSKTDLTTALAVNDGDSPIVPDTFELAWRAAAAASTDRIVHTRDGGDALVGDGAATEFEGWIRGAGADGEVDFTGVFVGPVVDGDTVTLDDGNATQIFEFDASGTHTVAAGNIEVDVSGAASDSDIGDAFVTAVNGATTVTFHAVNTAGVVAVHNLTPGADGNVTTWAATFVNVAPALTQPTGGLDLAGFDPLQARTVPATVVIKHGAVTNTLSTRIDRWTYATAATDPGAGTDYAIIDHRTGRFSMRAAAAIATDAIVTADFTGTIDKTASDNGTDGTLTGDLTSGSVDYDDGSYTLDLTGHVPHGPATPAGDGAPILATYEISAWDLSPVSRGTWANDVRVDVAGSVDFFDAETATYSRFDVNVLQLNTETGNFDVQEDYDELVFNDETSTRYFADVINDLSDLIDVDEPGALEAPGQLNGLARTQVIAAGDEAAGSQNVLATLGDIPVAQRTVSIAYTDTSDTARTITDDGTGNLIGDIDATGNNTITYTNGSIDLTTVAPIKAGTFVVVTYRVAAEETTNETDFGDTDQLVSNGSSTAVAWAAGTDGTFDSTNYGRNQFTSPTLVAPKRGLFALNDVEEIMQIAIPDFAGDVTITGDIIDYVESREELPPGADRFAILAAPIGSDPQETVDWLRFSLNRRTKYAAVYGPWINVADPLSDGRALTIPPYGHVAGVYARTDNNKNPGKAPGGTVDGQLNFLTGLEQVWNQSERDLVYQSNINPLRSGAEVGNAVWGVRTIAVESDWRLINARRVFMSIERSIWNETHWIVFENNGPQLWSRIKAQIESFLNNRHNAGWFAGTKPSESFRVVVDQTNNTEASILAGRVNIDIGIAPNRPAEFVVFRMSQKSVES